MAKKDEILEIIKTKGRVETKDLVKKVDVSRQYINQLFRALIKEGVLIKIGSTNKAFYVTPGYVATHSDELPEIFKIRLENSGLEEHIVWKEIKNKFVLVSKLKENVYSIFEFAFLEMLNNAIEHSNSKFIEIEIKIQNKELFFCVDDFGVGVFRNILKKRKLKSELEAIQDLLKGKTTTQPKLHTGEGIFFTSKIGDKFTLDSYGNKLIFNNKINDVFFEQPKSIKNGTKVGFTIDIDSKMHLSSVFKKYTNIDDESDYGFDRTEIKIKLYTIGGIYISRSQARRLLVGLDKFRSIILDFDKVPAVGQSFADEIFRIFQNKYPEITITPVNMNDAVEFMVKRAISK